MATIDEETVKKLLDFGGMQEAIRTLKTGRETDRKENKANRDADRKENKEADKKLEDWCRDNTTVIYNRVNEAKSNIKTNKLAHDNCKELHDTLAEIKNHTGNKTFSRLTVILTVSFIFIGMIINIVLIIWRMSK